MWLRYVAVSLAFALGGVLFRYLSIRHWIILSGFHVSVLLLTRYRYWPALLAGEVARLAYISWTCVDQFGLTWSLLNLLPSIAFIMPVVYVCRERWHLFPTRTTVHIGVLLSTALLAAGIITLNTLGMIAVTPFPPGYVVHPGEIAAQVVLGNYLGILTVAPLALLLHQKLAAGSWRQLWHRVGESRLVFESVFLATPVLLLLVWVGLDQPATRQFTQVAMFLPVVALALRHGWAGAAVGGSLASVALMVLMPQRNDPSTLQAEVVIAFAISTMLLVGARIAVLDRRAGNERIDVRQAIALAQRNVQAGELQLLMTSQVLEQIRETVHATCAMMLASMRHLAPAFDERHYRRQALIAQDQLYRLADSLYPVAWRERGLPAALREGTIPRVLGEVGIGYWCDLRGPLNLLPPAIHMAIYRITCEAVSEACSQKNVSDIDLRLRCGEHQGRCWIVLRIGFRANAEHVARIRWEELLPRVVLRTTSGLGRQAIEDRAATFEGQVRERMLGDSRRISVILYAPSTAGGV